MNLANKETQKSYYKLHKINIPHNVSRVFDKEMRGNSIKNIFIYIFRLLI